MALLILSDKSFKNAIIILELTKVCKGRKVTIKTYILTLDVTV